VQSYSPTHLRHCLRTPLAPASASPRPLLTEPATVEIAVTRLEHVPIVFVPWRIHMTLHSTAVSCGQYKSMLCSYKYRLARRVSFYHLSHCIDVVLHCLWSFQHWSTTTWATTTATGCRSTANHSFWPLPFLASWDDAVTQHGVHSSSHPCVPQHP
jgi:hypothetical protein